MICLATQLQHVDTVNLLLDHQADPNSPVPVDADASDDLGAGSFLIHNAAREGADAILRLLLVFHADVHKKDSMGQVC